MLIPFHLDHAHINLRVNRALLVTSINRFHIRNVFKLVRDNRPLVATCVSLLDGERACLLIENGVPNLTFV